MTFFNGEGLKQRHRNDLEKVDHAGLDVGRGGIFVKMFAGSS